MENSTSILDDLLDDQNSLSNIEQSVVKLAALSPLEYDQVREEEAEKMGVRVGTLDKEVTKARKKVSEKTDLVGDVEPWPEKVNGDELLNEIEEVIKKHVILPSGASTAITIWAVGTFCFDLFRIWAKLCISSPEKRCGKTTLMETISALCNRSLVASNISPAAIYRVIESWQPTLMIDEGDTFLHSNDELRGVINSGHTKSSAFVVRTVGDNHEPAKFSTWAPMAIAMIKTPPDTILDRSILITLRRKLPGESAQKLPLNFDDDCEELRQKVKRWAHDNSTRLKQHKPILPESSNDRALDNWMPLFAIADIVGNGWPEKVKSSFSILTQTEDDDDSIGPMILNDIRVIFNAERQDRMFSDALVDALIGLEERPWSEWKKGKALTQNSLSRLLRPYKIKSQTIRVGAITQKGYYAKSFQDAFERYLAPAPPIPFVQSETSTQVTRSAGCSDFQSVTKSDDVTLSKQLQTLPVAACAVVTYPNVSAGNEGEEGEAF